MKKLLGIILALTILLSFSATALALDEESSFSDIPDDWSHDAVVAAIENGLLQGHDGKVNPDGFLKRAEMAAVIMRAFGGTVKADISAFKDVTSDKWYYDAMAVAVQMGIFVGDGAELKPEDCITREQAALVLSRAMKLTDTDVDLSAFADADKVSEWALEGVAALVKAGYMQGDGKNLFPHDNISRKEFAQLMDNLVSGYVTEAGVIEKAAEGNIVVRESGVTLKGVTINGDVVVGDGVGDGSFTVKDCTINGRLIIRGGGANSIYIINSALNGFVTVTRRDGAVHISVDDGSQAMNVNIDDAGGDVILSGKYSKITVNAGANVVLNKATANRVDIVADNAALALDKEATVSQVIVAARKVDVDIAGKVTSINVVAAEGTAISGTGKVENVTAEPGSAQTSVDTAGTTVVNNSEAPVTTSTGEAIHAGTTGKTKEPTGGGGGGGGGGGYTPYYVLSLSISDSSNTVTAGTGSSTLSGTTSFYAQAALLLTGAKRSELRTAFGDDNARDDLDLGLSSFGNDVGWNTFKTDFFAKITGDEKALFENRNVTITDLLGTKILTYNDDGKTYTVTITVIQE